MNQKNRNSDEMEIDLLELFYVLWRKIGVIILSGILLALAAMLFTQVFIRPTYVSTTKIVVLNKQNRDTLTSSDMQTSTLLTKDYAELIKSRTVTESVIAELDLKLTHEQLLDKISVSTPSDTRIVTISVTDNDPYEASRIADAVRTAAAVHIQRVMDTEAVNVVDNANIPDKKSGPNVLKNGMMAGLLGCILAAAVVIVMYLLNDTIQTPEDVERYLELSNLGLIPLSENEKKGKKKKQSRQKMSPAVSKKGRDKR